MEDPKDTVEFTPQAVAEYLARTGEMDEFKELLNELVEASEVSYLCIVKPVLSGHSNINKTLI